MHELLPSLHGMYQQFIAVVKNKNHELQHSSGLIDAKNKPSTRIILIVQRARVQDMSVSVPQILVAEMVLRIVLAGRPMDIRQRHEPIA